MPKTVPVVQNLCLYEVEATFEDVGVLLCRGNVDGGGMRALSEVRRRNVAGDCPKPPIHLGARRFYFEETYR